MNWKPAARLVFFMALIAWPGVWAAPGDVSGGPGGWQWSPWLSFHLPGAKLRQRSFRVPLVPAEAARHLSLRNDMGFDRLQVLDGGLVLSGMARQDHWMALLRTEGGMTQGVVSLLSPDATPTAAFEVARILPSGGRSLLQGKQRPGPSAVTISAYRFAGDLATLQGQVRQTLVRQGWQPAEALWPGAQAWRGAAGFLQLRWLVSGAQVIVWSWHEKGKGS